MDRNDGRVIFLWGLKRSGIHFFVNWLFSNLGGTRKEEVIPDPRRHRLLQRGFFDPGAKVYFFNNCGHKNSRKFSLGPLRQRHFANAARDEAKTVFGFEDAAIVPAAEEARVDLPVTHVILMRDPLNNIASRLRAGRKSPKIFPTTMAYVDLYDAYSREFLSLTEHLSPKVPVSYNAMVEEEGYRDNIARALGMVNIDKTDEVPDFGGGSSFSGPVKSSVEALMKRYEEEPLPADILNALQEKEAIRRLCREVFHYDLLEVVGAAT